MTGLDQSSWAAELVAVLRVILALSTLTPCVPIHLRIDNMTVMHGVRDILLGSFSLPSFGFGLWHRLARCTSSHSLANFIKVSWVPAHGKHLDWVCEAGLASATARMLNDRADRSATDALKPQVVSALRVFEPQLASACLFSDRMLTRLEDATTRWLKHYPEFKTKADLWCRHCTDEP